MLNLRAANAWSRASRAAPHWAWRFAKCCCTAWIRGMRTIVPTSPHVRSAVVRRRPRAARRGSDSARSATRRGGHHRPVSRFLFGVPGGRPRADGRGNPKPEHVGHERSAAGTHVSAGYGSGAIACAAAACRRPHGAAGNDFQRRTRVAFLDLAEREPERFHVIDASQSIEDVWARIKADFDTVSTADGGIA